MLRTNRPKQPARSKQPKQRKQPERPIFPRLRPCQPLRIRRRHARRALSMHDPCWNPSYSRASRKSTDDERVVSLMHMLGWPAQFVCCSIAGTPPSRDIAACATSIRNHLPAHGDGTPQDCLIGEHDGHLVALVRVDDGTSPDEVARIAETCFDGHEPICLGPTRQNADGASRAIRAAINALFALKARTREVPQPMRCEDLLPENVP